MCLYQRSDKRGTIYLIVWVDDVVIVAENQRVVDEFMQQISNKFTVKDLGPLRYFLGIQFELKPGCVIMTQQNYGIQVLDRFGMSKAHPSKTPMVNNVHDELRAHIDDPNLDVTMTKRYQELVGSLIYLEQCTRPHLSYPTNLLGQFMSRPNKFHWELAKKCWRDRRSL